MDLTLHLYNVTYNDTYSVRRPYDRSQDKDFQKQVWNITRVKKGKYLKPIILG